MWSDHPTGDQGLSYQNAESLTRVVDYKVSAYLLDAYVEGALPGGTGHRSLGNQPRGLSRMAMILAGGLTPENVEIAMFVPTEWM